MVRSDFDSPHVQGARVAHGSVAAFRARRRYRIGRTRIAPRGGTDSGVGRRRSARGCRRRLSSSRATGETGGLAQGTAAHHGRGRSRSRHRGNPFGSGLFAPADRRESRQRRFARRRVGMSAAIVARRRHARDRYRRGNRSPLRLRQISAARLPHAAEEDRLRERLMALGYQEIVAIPLVDPECDAAFRGEDVTPAIIANPLSEDASTMRTSGVTSMVGAIEWNLNHGQRSLRLFEFGKAYELRAGKPVEPRVLTLGATGLAREQSVHEAPREFSFDDLKGDLDQIFALAGGARWAQGKASWLAAGRAAKISVAANGGKSIGIAGELARQLAQRFKLRQDVYLAELHLDSLTHAIAQAHSSLRYEPLPRFPAVERDFSLVLADGVTFAQVEETIRALQIPELRRIAAIDLFRGGQVPAGKYSLLVRVTFQSAEATFTEAQLAGFSSRIVSALAEKIGASLRAG